MAGEKHKQEVWSEFPQSSLSPWDKDTILLQGGCQMELTEKVPNGVQDVTRMNHQSLRKRERLVAGLLRRKIPADQWDGGDLL